MSISQMTDICLYSRYLFVQSISLCTVDICLYSRYMFAVNICLYSRYLFVHRVLTLLLRTGKQRFLFLTWHLPYYSERWSKSSIFSKWGKKGRTDRDSDCTNRYRLCKQISTVQTLTIALSNMAGAT
jgi:hypothetical protein